MTSKIVWYFCIWMTFIKSKVDRNISSKKSLPKNESLNSLDTKLACDWLDTLFIISNNYEGGLLTIRNHIWCSG